MVDDAKAIARQELATVASYATTYFGQSAAIAGTQREQEKLAGQLSVLKAEHALIKQAADTYDKDFIDRAETGRGAIGFWARRGVATLQDWVLLLFFAVYGVALLTFIGYAYKYSTRKVFTILFAAIIGPVIAVFFGAMILRFG